MYDDPPDNELYYYFFKNGASSTYKAEYTVKILKESWESKKCWAYKLDNANSKYTVGPGGYDSHGRELVEIKITLYPLDQMSWTVSKYNFSFSASRSLSTY